MGDYASKTADLSLAEHGAYNLLLDTCYSTEKPLPAAYEALYRLCRAMSKDEQTAVRSVADRFFPLGSDNLRSNPRATDEIAKAQVTIDKQRQSGVESASKRWSTDRSTHESTHRSTDAAAIQPPTTNLHTPTSNHQPLTTSLQPPKVKTVSDLPQKTRQAEPGKTVPVWQAYATRYQQRYGAEPTRNAKINGMLARFLDRVPAEEAPAIAEFFVGHNGQFYVTKMHCIDLLLQDAEKLRTEWLTGRKMTGLEAKSAEQTDAVAEQIKRVGERLQA